jgi:hypothetical protein
MKQTAKDLQLAYHGFFVNNEAGKYFMQELARNRADSHDKAEDNPTQALVHSQRAKAYREISDHIQSVINSMKKGEPKE